MKRSHFLKSLLALSVVGLINPLKLFADKKNNVVPTDIKLPFKNIKSFNSDNVVCEYKYRPGDTIRIIENGDSDIYDLQPLKSVSLHAYEWNVILYAR